MAVFSDVFNDSIPNAFPGISTESVFTINSNVISRNGITIQTTASANQTNQSRNYLTTIRSIKYSTSFRNGAFRTTDNEFPSVQTSDDTEETNLLQDNAGKTNRVTFTQGINNTMNKTL